MIGEVVVGLILLCGLVCVADWIDHHHRAEGAWSAFGKPAISFVFLLLFLAACAWAAAKASTR